ncbi:Acetyltransferase component of pyruvate dehydrogenase complex [Mycena indigotica]|uniref:Acetyltransferase component of pyruvate dehydrogenase complex n=1 Tax=Mycena indigotica TaxID=2126181 RepID=A0A8H6SYL7_9AGAR|nr:Acetyltransferase component of pyruvate dehydrogenase complex [Mycena indigotica]KAF7307031.1 Acetyltransferase component of pyruvate dehydrogenase complex [Mycena indigotica]
MAFTPSDPAVISIRFTPERLRLLEGLQQADQRDFEALHQELENTVQERNTLRSDNAALRAEISSLKAENNRLAAENGDPSYLTETPRGRLNELKRFPELVDVPAFDNLPIYSRDYLSTQLGGSIQPLIVPIGKQKQLSASLQIKKFLVPNQSMNPWCPRAPGQHGFMFVGLGAESHTFEQEECLPLFVSKPRSGGNLEASYFGDYHVSRVEPLTLEEWNTLAPAVQKSYAQCTARKEKRDYDWISTLHAYNAGLKRVPCVRLVCVAFRYELFQGLSAPTLTLKRKRSVGDLSDGE